MNSENVSKQEIRAVADQIGEILSYYNDQDVEEILEKVLEGYCRYCLSYGLPCYCMKDD